MNNFKLFCITNIQAKELEDLPLDLVGVGRNKFNNNYIVCLNQIYVKSNYSYFNLHTFDNNLFYCRFYVLLNEEKNYKTSKILQKNCRC